MSGISNADSSYRPLYLQREYKGGGGRRGGGEGGAREHTTPRKRAVSLSLSLSLYELLFHGDDVHSRAVPFRPPDGRAAVADKLPHYAYAAYAPPKFAAGSPCSQPLKTLYFVRFLASFLTRYIYIYIPPLSPLLSRASLRTTSLRLFPSLSFPGLPHHVSPEHPPRVGGSCHVHSIFYFLYRVATSSNVAVSFHDVRYTEDRLVRYDYYLWRLRYVRCVTLGWRLIETRKRMMVLWWIQVRIDLREVVEQLFFMLGMSK